MNDFHKNLLEDSAIDLKVAQEFKAQSINKVSEIPEDIIELGTFVKDNIPALNLELQTIDGKKINCFRPDNPTFDGKYLFPKGKSGIIIHPCMSNLKSKDGLNVIIIEGVKQHLAGVSNLPKDCIALGINGCYGWSEEGTARPELNNLKFLENAKTIYISFDADLSSNANVWEAGKRLSEHLKSIYSAKIKFISIPAGGKNGLDDFLAKIPQKKRQLVMSNLMNTAKDKLGRKPKLKKATKEKVIAEASEPKIKGEVPEQFYKPNLLENIYLEIDKHHKKDEKEKIALFLIRTTAELRSERDRCSGALKGESSSGKDNAIKTIFDLFPEEDSFILTRGTQSALEEQANKVKAIAFSEINANRDNGANSDLTEFFKQLSEGGCRIIKRDKLTNEVLDLKSEQKSLFYGTTETQSDDELQTRYVVIPIRSNKQKNRIVVNDVLNGISTPHNILNKISVASWIKEGIRNLDHDVEVVIPFADQLKEKIKDIDGKEEFFFDETKDRIKRDVKRLISLTKAVTWLYQKQRKIEEYEGVKFIYAEPTDFLVVVEIFAEFFNLTYNNWDYRIQTCYDKIKHLEGKHDGEIIKLGYPNKYLGWVLRHKLQEELNISCVDTIRKRVNILKKQHGGIDTFYDKSVNNKGYLVKTSGCDLGTNRVSLPVSALAIRTHFASKLTPSKIQEIYGKSELKAISLEFLQNKEKEGYSFEKLTPSKLTPSISRNTSNIQSIKETFDLMVNSGEEFSDSLLNQADDPKLMQELKEKYLAEGKIREIKPNIYRRADK